MDDDELLALELEVAKSICPDFDPSRSDAWRDLIGAMCDNHTMRQELKRLERPKKKAGAKSKRERVDVLARAYIKWRRTAGTQKSASAFQRHLQTNGHPLGKLAPKTFANLLAKRKAARRWKWYGRRLLRNECEMAALGAAQFSTTRPK